MFLYTLTSSPLASSSLDTFSSHSCRLIGEKLLSLNPFFFFFFFGLLQDSPERPFLSCAGGPRTEHITPSVASPEAEERGRIISLGLLATLLMHPDNSH